jgi:RNA polymerase sigma factor (TIGR02999 family)
MLDDWTGGNASVAEQLFPAIYQDLRRIASRQMWRERADHTLQPTALVHEAYLKLMNQTRVKWQNRSHFLGVAAQLMRRILLKYAERRRAAKRGGEDLKLAWDDKAVGDRSIDPVSTDAIALDRALIRLSSHDSRQTRIVELYAFAGLNLEEIAEELGLSLATVKREWRMARAWLHGALVHDVNP